MFEDTESCSDGGGYSLPAEVVGKVHGLHGFRYTWLCDSCAKRLDVTFDNDGAFQMVAKAA